jgi:hypothetical protein
MNEAETKAYGRGYQCGSERWPAHKPPMPPEPIVRDLMAAARELRDAADTICASLCEDDDFVISLGPKIDAVDEVLIKISNWLRKPEP